MKRTAIVLAVLCGLLLGSAGPAGAQITYDPNREDYVLLALNQAYIQLGQSARAFLRVREQFDDGLVSAEEYERSVTTFQSAKEARAFAELVSALASTPNQAISG